MKKDLLTCISVVFLLVFTGTFHAMAQEFNGEEGTPENPYQVATTEDLNNVRNYLNAHFVQTADIDLGVAPWNEGEGWAPIGEASAFTGSYDGDGHVISNLTINRPEEEFIGLFAWVAANAEIRNLGLQNISVSGKDHTSGLVANNSGTVNNCYIQNATVSGGVDITGGLVGWNGGKIENCSATGIVSGVESCVGGLVGTNENGLIANSNAACEISGYEDAGGLVGWNGGGIFNCYATGTVAATMAAGGLVGNNDDYATVSSSYATGVVTAGLGAGGLAGLNNDILSTISDCYATGKVTGDTESQWGGIFVGGLVGLNGNKTITADGGEIFPGLVENSYAIGSVSGGDYVGGLIGSQGVEYDQVKGEIVGPADIGKVENSFWNTDINAAGVGFGDASGAAGKNTSEMQNQTTFTDAGWDFETIWTMPDYPDLVMGDYVPNIEDEDMYLQYLNHENEDNSIYRGWFGYSKNGKPVKTWEIKNTSFTDSGGNSPDMAYGVFWFHENYSYNCFSGDCGMSGLNSYSGYVCGFGNLAADQYQVGIETIYGQTVTSQVDYPGKLELPVVSSSTMRAGYDNGDLILSWANPDQFGWNDVDRLRIVLLDEMDHQILWVTVAPDEESVVIPGDILDSAETIYGTNFTQWQVQTDAFDGNGMNYARGISNNVDAAGISASNVSPFLMLLLD